MRNPRGQSNDIALLTICLIPVLVVVAIWQIVTGIGWQIGRASNAATSAGIAPFISAAFFGTIVLVFFIAGMSQASSSRSSSVALATCIITGVMGFLVVGQFLRSTHLSPLAAQNSGSAFGILAVLALFAVGAYFVRSSKV